MTTPTNRLTGFMSSASGVGIDAALRRYQVMAYVVGVGLAVLVFIGVPLQFAAGHPGMVEVVGPLHGVLYIVYLLAALDLARRARFSLVQMLAMIGAGLVPLMAFFVERWIVRRMQAGMVSWRGRPVGGSAPASPGLP